MLHISVDFPAPFHHDDMGADVHNEVDVVLDQDYCHAEIDSGFHDGLAQLARLRVVHAGRRLVEQQQDGARHQREEADLEKIYARHFSSYWVLADGHAHRAETRFQKVAGQQN
jgi:hypothetical protein